MHISTLYYLYLSAAEAITKEAIGKILAKYFSFVNILILNMERYVL
jgi:hypothetical protein